MKERDFVLKWLRLERLRRDAARSSCDRAPGLRAAYSRLRRRRALARLAAQKRYPFGKCRALIG